MARPTSPWTAVLAMLAGGLMLGLLLWGWLVYGESELLGLHGAPAMALGALLLTGLMAGLAALLAWNWVRSQQNINQALTAERDALAERVQADTATRERRLQAEQSEGLRLAAREAQLRQHEAEWQALQAAVAVSVTDLQGRIVEVNARFCELSGYRREEVLGMPHRIIASGQHPPSFWARFWFDLQAGRVWRGLLCNRTKSGELFWVDVRVAPLFDAEGQPSRYLCVATDVSSLARRERERSLESERLSAVIDGVQAGTWEWHYQTGALRLNARLAALLGLGANVQSFTWMGLRERMHPEDLERLQAALRRHLTGQSPLFEADLRLSGADGRWRWCEMRGTVVQRTPSDDPFVLAGTILNVDERRAAEERARIQQLISARTQRLAHVGGFELRLPDQQLTWTDETFHLHELAPGSPPTWEQALGYVQEEDRETLRKAIATAVSEARGWDLELRLRTALGRERWVRMVGEAEYDDSGPLRLVGAIQDVGAQRALEESLLRQQALLRTVVDHLPLGVSVFGPDLKLLARSRALAELLDLPADLLVEGRTSYEDLLSFNRQRGEYGEGAQAEQTLQRLMHLAQDPVPHHFERTRPNGMTLDVRGAPMPGGGLVSTYIDISERKRAEQAMRAQEHFLRLVADAVPGRIAYWTRSGRCVFANRAFAAELDSTPERIVGLTAEEMQVGGWIADLPARLSPLFHQAATLRYEQEDGAGHTLLVHLEPDVAEDGSARGVVTMAMDITALKSVQHQTEQLNHLLSVERDRANAASVAKSQFLATMSHEIRTPLNAVLGMLRLLRRTPLVRQQLDYVSKSEGAAKSLLALLNDILDFSKVEAGRLDLEQRPFALDELLRQTAVILAATAAAKPIELVFNLDPALPERLVGDLLRLQQVLINLGGNAVKFTAEGEVVLHLRLLQLEGGRARIGFAVQDSGIGIAEDKQAHVFEGFSQAEASTTRRYGGTGLGLAISRRLVQAMGGDLHLHSRLGQGSVFSFDVELPVHEATPSAPEPLPSQRLLLVEPHEASRAALEALLTHLGLQVTAVARGDEARTALAADAGLALAWVAATLPDEDGWHCAKALQAMQRGRGASLRWWLTGNALQREPLAARLVQPGGPAGFVLKPICASLAREALQSEPAFATTSTTLAAPAPQAQPLAGLHLLVAEDNPNNQQVAQELLEHEGAQVTLADDGEQALALLRRQRFDAVLMDMQMPVMDGLSATRAIRNELGLTAAQLPIVAMTANAMPADRETCLAAGMNEHVGKPFELDALVTLLLRLIPERAGSTATQAAAAAPEAAAASDPAGGVAPQAAQGAEPPAAPKPARKLPSLRVPAERQQRAMAFGLDLQAGMDRFLGRTELYLRTARSFAQQGKALPALLRQAMGVEPPDCTGAQQALHSFKGLAATLACERLAQWGRAGEERARAGQVLEVAWIDSFEAQLAEGLQLLLEEAQALHEPAAVPAPPPAAAAPPLLQRLQRLLDGEDAGPLLDLVAQERDGLGAWLGEDLERIDEALASLDFAAARRVLAERLQPA